MDPKLLSISEAASILHVHPATLRRWDSEGRLKAIIVSERGDRKYRESEVLEFLGSNPKLIKYSEPIIYKNAKIIWDSQGFVNFSGRFGVIARIIIHEEAVFTGFAFATSGLQVLTQIKNEADLDGLAIEKVKSFIDRKLLKDEDVYTFEYAHGEFRLIENPEWWEGKYSKTLTEGLRVEAHHSVPESNNKKAWRVIVRFLTKQAGGWLTQTFGANHQFVEYFVWVDSQELNRRHLPNTAKSAEIVAIEYMLHRFQETADENDIRDITRIDESVATCREGVCVPNKKLTE